MVLIAVGIVLLGLTYWDYVQEETMLFGSTLGFFGVFEISKESSPTLYWLILIAQGLAGLTMIVFGLRS